MNYVNFGAIFVT